MGHIEEVRDVENVKNLDIAGVFGICPLPETYLYGV
jgi:hypothetical protein